MRRLLIVVLAVSILLAACTPRGDDSVEGQLRSNQALLLVLQNQQGLDHLYFSYNGDESANAFNENSQLASGKEQIGELNLMMHNIGSSVTAGGLYVSGYDPNLIEIEARLGQVPINKDRSTCVNGYTEIAVLGTGQYSVTKFCQLGNSAIGGQVRDRDGEGFPDDITISGINVPFRDIVEKFTDMQENRDSLWYTALGLFSDNRVDCNVHDGKFGCQIIFGNPNFDVNRASHGYRLMNLMRHDVSCKDNCRPFPPLFENGRVLHGVSDDYPLGDVIYYDYDIILNRAAWNEHVNEMKQTFQVTSCYGYTTTVTPNVCVDPDPTNNRNDACSTSPMLFKDPQGAPIKVTRIEQRAQPGKMAYTIHVEHVGGGQVWEPGSFDECGPYYNGRPDLRHMDTVQLLDARILGQPDQLECLPRDTQGKHYVRLQNGKGQITCLYPLREWGITQNSAYSSAIALEFGYVYQNTVRKDVLIHRT